VVNVRKLVALDMAYNGARFILAEFAVGVAGPLALGLFIVLRSHSARGVLLGTYFLGLALDYVPLLLYSVAIARGGNARAEVAGELDQGRRAALRYFRWSLLLLVPFVFPAAALMQRRRPVSPKAEGRAVLEDRPPR